MKKIICLLVALCCLGACKTIEEAKAFANCKYTIVAVEMADFNITSLGVDLIVGITNLNKKKDASIKKFVGNVTMNETPVGQFTLENIRVEAGSTKNQKVHVDIPTLKLGSKLVGLVSMGSASVDYQIKGTAYFETPLGDVPVPVDIGRRGSNN